MKSPVLLMRTSKKLRDPWERIRGMWARKPVQGVAWQRRVRRASDKRLIA